MMIAWNQTGSEALVVWCFYFAEVGMELVNETLSPLLLTLSITKPRTCGQWSLWLVKGSRFQLCVCRPGGHDFKSMLKHPPRAPPGRPRLSETTRWDLQAERTYLWPIGHSRERNLGRQSATYLFVGDHWPLTSETSPSGKG